MRFDVVVIGAGAAGMMCAAEAARRGRGVLLVEHAAKVGERIRISGGGRCNFTNLRVGPDNYLSQNPHFCRSALSRFTPSDFIRRIEQRGIPWHEKTLGQLFCDGSSQQVIDLLVDDCARTGVRWAHPCRVERVERTASEGFRIVTDSGIVASAALVVATGGLSVPKLGASPFGYRLAEQFGIPVVAPKPALVPLALPPDTLASLQPLAGVSLPGVVGVSGGRPDARFLEKVLVTHRGLSGPAILQVSSYWVFQEYSAGPRRPIEIDLLPGDDAHAWLGAHARERLLLPNLLAERMPRSFAREWCVLHGWEKPLNQFAPRELSAVASALEAWVLSPAGTLGFAKAEVTLGGVDTRALSSRTMEAAAVPGLYFIGEVVDVTGWLGGYNFQWAWSSGWAAGQFA
jgi:predicted Rossmann fold flavoprotein